MSKSSVTWKRFASLDGEAAWEEYICQENTNVCKECEYNKKSDKSGSKE